MGKIIAIHGGGDWYDASADYVVLNDGVDIDEEHKKYRDWYNDEYRPALKAKSRPKYYTFTEWLLRSGARETTSDELEIFNDY